MRRLLSALALIALLILPTAAQSTRDSAAVPTFASLLPDDTTFLLSLRADTGYLETLKGVWPRLQNELIGSSNFPSYESIFETGPMRDLLQDTGSWRGDHLAFAALTPDATHNLLTGLNSGISEGGIVILFEVKDRTAAETWLAEEIAFTTESTLGDFALYTVTAQDVAPIILLSETHMLITVAHESVAGMMTNDFARLSDNPTFTETLSALPFGQSGYDITGYVNASAIVRELNAREFVTREITPYRQFRFALADFVGTGAFGAVIQNGADFILDGAWEYGDAAGLAEFGIDPTRWITNAIDPTFFITAPQDTQFYLQSTDLAGTYRLAIDGLTALSDLATTSPEFDTYFGLSELEGQNLGGLIRGATTLSFAGLTGLNLENDVLSVLEDTDFALTFNVVEDDEAPLGFHADAALIARHTGGAEAWLPALAQAAALYGYPDILPQTIGNGQALDFGPILDPMIAPALGQAAADDPTFDPMLGVNDAIAVAGTRRAAEYALNAPTDLSTVRIAFPPAFSLFIENPQVIGYINGEALQSAPDWKPNIAHATFSGAASETGIVGRMTFSLAAQER